MTTYNGYPNGYAVPAGTGYTTVSGVQFKTTADAYSQAAWNDRHGYLTSPGAHGGLAHEAAWTTQAGYLDPNLGDLPVVRPVVG